ncbi:MAG: MFS transporter [Caldilineaceae bacterium]|nr:MFS transporter [Caldilineaceae bacterium]
MTSSTVSQLDELSTPEPTTVEKLRGLPWSILSNAANTIFSQFTFFGSTFVLFLSYLNMDKTQIGFLLSLIPFAGLVALFISSWVARFGFKRTYIVFFGLRKVITIGLLLTPWVAANWGSQGLLLFITLIMGGFALSRAVAETGFYPWVQEYIPNSVRGKYSAQNSIYTTLVGLGSVAVAGYVLDRTPGSLSGYMGLISAGLIFGFISVWAASRIPGGAAVKAESVPSPWRGMAIAARDRNFMRYLVGAALITLGVVPMGSFLPLYMQEVVGLSEGQTVLLQSGALVGNLVSSLPWGWASDRYGSKPVMISGLVLKILLPVLWFTMPRESEMSFYVAMGIAVLLGISDMAWGIGAGRLLFVSVVPPEKKLEYMPLHYAWVGTIGGLSQLLGGILIDLFVGIDGTLFGFALNAYSPLFALGFVLTVATTLLLMGMRADNVFGVGEFAGMFFRGNPFLAVNALVRYYMAKDERSTISVTERLGLTKSPLAVDELVEALQDPRFNVRIEAIISVARMPADPRLTAALLEVLKGTELALKAMAAWALGRIGDKDALPALREELDSPYLSIRAQSARALGALRDRTLIPELRARLRVEKDKGLQMAYASALGNMRAEEAVPDLLSLLDQMQNPGARLELALSLARILGQEHVFVGLLRQMREDPDTATAQALGNFRRRIERVRILGRSHVEELAAATDAFGRGRRVEAIQLMCLALRALPPGAMTPVGARILTECLRQLETSGTAHMEYLLLTLHVLEVACTV